LPLSDPVLLAVLGGIGTGFLMLVRWLKEDRDFWRDAYLRTVDSTEVATEVAEKSEKHDPVRLSPHAADAAQRIVRRAQRG
jgi:hypothetical protein